MANEITTVNGVTKRTVSPTVFQYVFPKAILETDTSNADVNEQTYKLYGANSPQSSPIKFKDITDKLGAANIVAYADALANGGYFFDGAISQVEASIPDSIIVVKEASQLSGALSSNVVYLIDDGVDMGTQQITVPSTGLYIRGISNNIGGLSSSEDNYTMFVGGGNLFIDRIRLQASGANSQIFNLTDPIGFSAIECTTVNFENSTSLGTLTDYRQGLWQNVGVFGCADGLTLAGSWLGGFAIFTAIVRSFDTGDTGGTIIKADALATFGSRIYSDGNFQVNGTSVAYSFIEANFNNDQSFQLRNGILSGSGTYVSGITVQSTKSLWSSVGIPSTLPGGKVTWTASTATVITATSTPVKAAGTTALTSPIWVTQLDNNKIQWDSEISGDIRIYGVLSLVSGNNNQIRVSMRIYDSLDVLQGTLTFPIVTTNGAGRAENITIVDTATAVNGYYAEIWVENLSSTSNITVEVESRYIFEQRKAV